MDNKTNGKFTNDIEILKNNPDRADVFDNGYNMPGTAQYFIEYY